MPTCGNCKKSVSESDVTCPHCGVLLAAYYSPAGSISESTYVAPEQPPSADIPEVDLTVKPPVEAEIVTDPTKVAVPVVSTAPKPLFDTNLTVEEISKAAEGDHAEDVVTISDKKVVTQAPSFDVPDYARPPADAAPIPVVEDAEGSIPLITAASAPTEREQKAESGKTVESSADESQDDDESDPGGESWLSSNSTASAAVESQPKPNKKAKPKPKQKKQKKPAKVEAKDVASPKFAEPTSPEGTTDDYLRKLHARVGYVPETETVSRPVDTRSKPQTKPSKRNRRPVADRDSEVAHTKQPSAKPNPGCLSGYAIVLFLLWISTITSTLSGDPSVSLIIITVVATWGYPQFRKASKSTRSK